MSLNFNHTIAFLDSQTIELVLEWESPPSISADGPDMIVVTFNGPFYDK